MAGVPDWRELWVKLNRPSAERFRQALVKRGMVAPSVKQIRELFLKYQSSKQLFAPPPRYTGHVYSPGLDARWQADVMIYSQPSEYRGENGVNTCQLDSKRREHEANRCQHDVKRR